MPKTAKRVYKCGAPELEKLMVPIGDLSPDPNNARRHPEKNLDAIKASLLEFGYQKPVVADSAGTVVAGNGTMTAAIAIGWTHIPAVRTNLTGAKLAAYGLADNRTAELAEWDSGAVQRTIDAIKIEVPEFDFNGVGLGVSDLADIIEKPKVEVVEDQAPEPLPEAVSKRGDLWVMGEHRLLCGDSTKHGDVGRVMAGNHADVCFTSPPYAQQRDYGAKISDWDSLMRGVFANLPMSDDGQVLVNIGLIHEGGEWVPYWEEWISWMSQNGWRRFGWYIWDKISATFKANDGRFWMSHEWVFHFNKKSVLCEEWVECKHAGEDRGPWGQRKAGGQVEPLATPGAIKSHKPPDSVIRIQRETNNADPSVRSHPARFPVAFAEYVLRTFLGNVYEPFAGSGTTIIACEQLDRKCYAIELEPTYVDVCVRRWEKLTGKSATLDGDGRTFAEVSKARLSKPKRKK